MKKIGEKFSAGTKVYLLPSIIIGLGMALYLALHFVIQDRANVFLGRVVFSDSQESFEDTDQRVAQEGEIGFQNKDSQMLQIDPLDQVAPKDQVVSQENKATRFRVDADRLNVRLDSNLYSKVQFKLRKDDEVEVLEVRDGWARIEGGWVLLRYLKEQ